MSRILIACLFSLSVCLFAEEPPAKTSSVLREIHDDSITIAFSKFGGGGFVNKTLIVRVTKDTKYFLDEIQLSEIRDERGRRISKTTRKEITFKDLEKGFETFVVGDKKGNTVSVWQTLDKRPNQPSGYAIEITPKEIMLSETLKKAGSDSPPPIKITLTKETKYFLEEVELTGKKDDDGNPITKVVRKEITFKELTKNLETVVVYDAKYFASSVTQIVVKRFSVEGVPSSIKK